MERAKLNEAPVSLVRAPIYRPHKRVIEIDEYQLFQLASIGCTQPEAAQFFACSTEHLIHVLTTKDEMMSAWKRGSAQAVISLRHLQHQHAKRADASGVAMTIHMSKHRLKEGDKIVAEHVGKGGGPIRMSFDFDSPAERARNAGITD